MPASIETRVKDILEDKLGIKREDIVREASLINDLGADSLDQLEVIMEMEKQFNIPIPDEAIEKIFTVGDIIDYIENSTAK